ncbi:S-layer domain protein [Calothrix parasitica NIES-267]|uniref:S-layer domain protein n=1 Tax=Calothrix parasitica NIES-267 TaxID=1973488 RepID=A0A1Z4LJJ4_9CYAN|nr:S-layer domain protein [Calothrix parasitica NIES-267]
MLKNFKLLFLLSSSFYLLLTTTPVKAEEIQIEESSSGMSQVTNVNQLSDVQPTDWAFQALQSLVERYGCIAGYPNGTFRGNRAMTRYEFAAGLNACLDRVNELIAAATTDVVNKEDLATLQRLQESFAAELATLRGRVDTLEARTAEIEANQFSTTTKLRGQAIFAVNGGGFDGNSIIDANGTTVANDDPNTTMIFRAGIDLDTSFNKTDLLKIRLETGSGILGPNGQPDGGRDNAAGFLEPSFGSALDYSINPPTDRDIELSRLYYTFKPSENLAVTIGPNMRASDFLDFNSYAKLSFRDFSTQAFVNNYVLFPIEFPSAGAVIDWKPSKRSPLAVRAAYTATDAANPSDQGIIIGNAPFINVLYDAPNPNIPNAPSGGGRGLFGDNYQGVVEVEFSPSRDLALRLQYSGGEVFDNRFDAIGANLEFTLAKKIGIFGRYGYSSYDNTNFGDINPNYWMAGVAFRDLFTRGALAGVAVGQPFIANEVGNSTQTNYEAFYNYPISRNVQITPTLQVIENAANQDANGTIYTGTLRTTFSF